MQYYDADKTTDFSCSFLEPSKYKKSKKNQWQLRFTQGFISIYSPDTRINIYLNFPAEEHWIYTEIESHYRSGAIISGAEIKTKAFTLEIFIKEYVSEDDPGFDPEFDSQYANSEPEGFFRMYVNNPDKPEISFDLPYRVAAGIIKLASGSTDLEGAIHVQKHK